MAKAIGMADLLYCQYVNRLHGRTGHLWQARFYSCVLGPTHLTNALCYVERNPVRAGIADRAWRYQWSSAAAHVGAEPDRTGLLDLAEWRRWQNPDAWREGLIRMQDDALLAEIRSKTHRGRPFASDSFISKLEATLGKRLRPLPHGRPRKQA